MNVIAYRRVSTDQQGESGLGLAAQTAAVEQYAALHGHEIVAWEQDVASGGKDDREGLERALAQLAAGEAEGLIVAKLDRLARSIAQVDRILTLSTKQGWTFAALDLSVDTATASGRMVANVLAAVAQWERETIGERTSAALQAKKARLGGTLPGTRPAVQESVRERLKAMRSRGMTLKAIADSLQADRVPTAQGGRWHASTVRHVLNH